MKKKIYENQIKNKTKPYSVDYFMKNIYCLKRGKGDDYLKTFWKEDINLPTDLIRGKLPY